MQGKFISFEGGEGCGKTTQIHRLADTLRKLLPGREILESRSPGGTPAAEKIRAVLKERTPGDDLAPETELLLFAACHAQMCDRFIRPALQRGAILLIDRFTDSTEVYQGCARHLDPSFIRTVDRFACRNIVPDLTILLDIEPSAGLARAGMRSEQLANDRFDSETLSFHTAVRNGFLALAREHRSRVAVVDAFPSADIVHTKILEVLRERLDIF